LAIGANRAKTPRCQGVRVLAFFLGGGFRNWVQVALAACRWRKKRLPFANLPSTENLPKTWSECDMGLERFAPDCPPCRISEALPTTINSALPTLCSAGKQTTNLYGRPNSESCKPFGLQKSGYFYKKTN